MLKNLKYYSKRNKDTDGQITQITQLAQNIEHANAIDELMGIEGNIRMAYYSAFGEIIKPLLADRLIFSLLNKRIIQKNDFDQKLNSCLLKESGRKKIMRAWDEKLNETIKHRTLDRSISYKRLVRLECYKLVKHVMGMQEYKPFKAWW